MTALERRERDVSESLRINFSNLHHFFGSEYISQEMFDAAESLWRCKMDSGYIRDIYSRLTHEKVIGLRNEDGEVGNLLTRDDGEQITIYGVEEVIRKDNVPFRRIDVIGSKTSGEIIAAIYYLLDPQNRSIVSREAVYFNDSHIRGRIE